MRFASARSRGGGLGARVANVEVESFGNDRRKDDIADGVVRFQIGLKQTVLDKIASTLTEQSVSWVRADLVEFVE